jgi:hypothetical protein
MLCTAASLFVLQGGPPLVDTTVKTSRSGYLQRYCFNFELPSIAVLLLLL